MKLVTDLEKLRWSQTLRMGIYLQKRSGSGWTKLDIRMNKPVYPGQAVSDLSKTLMCKFYYDYMQAKYGSKVK